MTPLRLVVGAHEGVHLRVASAIARAVEETGARVQLVHDGRRADGRSAIEILALGLAPGSQVELHASGPGADEACAQVRALIEGTTP